jgi:hypothetical protein
MRPSLLLPTLIVLLCGAAPYAQEPPPEAAAEPAAPEAPEAGTAAADDGEFAPVPEPPVIPNRLEDGQPIEPQVTIRRRGENVVEEYRANGRLFMVRITPRVGKPYYLLDRDGDGRMESRMSELWDEFAVPQWVIFSW